MSLLNDLLDAIVTAQAGIGLKVENVLLGVAKRKLPKREETVDPGYQVTVSGAEQLDTITRIGFGSVWQVLYNVDITLITPGDHDAAINLPDHITWREATRARYMRANPLPAVPEMKRIELVPAAFLDRSQLAAGYDYNMVSMRITTYERRP